MSLTALVLALTPATARERELPFSPGEKLSYKLRWGPVPVAEALFEVRAMTTVNEKPSLHFAVSGRTSSTIDVIYKVRGQADAYAHPSMSGSLLYKQDHTERRKHRNITLTFDQANRQVQYSKFGDKRPPISLQAGCFDPLSLLYHFRTLDFFNQTNLKLSVTDGKKCILLRIKNSGRQTVTIASGTYDTYLLEPDTSNFGGIFKQSKNPTLKIWITADQHRIPVKVSSKVLVGSFVGELVSASGLK